MSKLKLASLLTATLFVPLTAFAAGSAVLNTDDGNSEISWLDQNTARINMDSGSEYILVRDKHLYVVSNEAGQPQVMDLTDLGQAMMSLANEQGFMADLDADKVKAVTSTGKSVAIAGIQGEVYTVKLVDESGNTKTKELVLTDDETVNELTDVYVNVIGIMLGKQDVDQVLAKLPADKQGVLKAENAFVVESISAKTPDASLFELPAKPQGLQDLLSIIGNKLGGD